MGILKVRAGQVNVTSNNPSTGVNGFIDNQEATILAFSAQAGADAYAVAENGSDKAGLTVNGTGSHIDLTLKAKGDGNVDLSHATANGAVRIKSESSTVPGALTLLDNDSSAGVTFKANATTTAYALTYPASIGSNNQVLQLANVTGSNADITFATLPTSAVTALNNQAESRLVTIGNPTTELDGEAQLTFDGSTLKVGAAANAHIKMALFGPDGGTGNNLAEFSVDNEGSLTIQAIDKDSASDYTQEAHIKLDAEGEIHLDSAAGMVYLKSGGLQKGALEMLGSDISLRSDTGKLIFDGGNDGIVELNEGPDQYARFRRVSSNLQIQDGSNAAHISLLGSGDVEIARDLRVGEDRFIGTANDTDMIQLDGSSNLVKLAGNVSLAVDVINESDANAGITAEGVLLKDSEITLNKGAGAGDVIANFQQAGTTLYTVGIDDDDSEKFKIHAGNALAGTSSLELDSSGNLTVNGATTTITGNLVVNGSQFKVDGETVVVDDTLFELATVGKAPPTGSTAAKDKGFILHHHDGSSASKHFMGFDSTNESGKFTFKTGVTDDGDGSISGGSIATVKANVEGTVLIVDSTNAGTGYPVVFHDESTHGSLKDSQFIEIDPGNKKLQFIGGDAADIASLAVDANGGLSITTVDAAAAAANIVLTADGAITLDSAGDINLDADDADIVLKDGGTEFGRFTQSGSDLVIQASINNQDMIFKGVDNGSPVTALTIEMDEAGKATFNNAIVAGTTVTVGSALVSGSASDNHAVRKADFKSANFIKVNERTSSSFNGSTDNVADFAAVPNSDTHVAVYLNGIRQIARGSTETDGGGSQYGSSLYVSSMSGNGSGGDTLTLNAANASASDDFYNGAFIRMTSGGQNGKVSQITDYDETGGVKTATVAGGIVVNSVSNGDTYQIFTDDCLVKSTGSGSSKLRIEFAQALASDDIVTVDYYVD